MTTSRSRVRCAAWIDTDLNVQIEDEEQWVAFGKIAAQANSAAGWGAEKMTKYFNPVVLALIDLLKKAMPECDEATIFWGYHFVSGAMTHNMARTGRLDELSHGLCSSSDFASISSTWPGSWQPVLRRSAGAPPPASNAAKGSMDMDGAVPASNSRIAGYPLVVLALLCLVYVLNFLDRQLLSILAKPIQDDLGLTDGQLGRLGGLYFALFYCILGIPVAWLADRGNRVRVLTVACALWSVATAACGLAQTYPQLAAARMSVGIGEAGGVPPSYSIISDYFPASRRGTALGLFNLGPPIGQALGVAFGAKIAAAYSWRPAFMVLGVAGVVAAAVVWAVVREPRRGATDAHVISEEVVSFWATLRMFATRPTLTLVSLVSRRHPVRHLRHPRLYHAVPDAREGNDSERDRDLVRAGCRYLRQCRDFSVREG